MWKRQVQLKEPLYIMTQLSANWVGGVVYALKGKDFLEIFHVLYNMIDKRSNQIT